MQRFDPYGAIYRNALFPAWESLFRGRPTLARLAELRDSQYRSAEELSERQAASMRRLLEHAFAHCPFYRRRFEEQGVTPADIHDQAELAKLPILTREEARDSLASRASAAPPFPTIEKTTSGSSGKPLTIAYDVGSESWRQAVKWRAYGWAGYRPGDRAIHYWGPQTPMGTRKKRIKVKADRFLRRENYLDCVMQSDDALAAVVRSIARKKPAVIVAYAQSAGNLARYVNEKGVRDWGPIPVICTAEQLFPDDREQIRRAFGDGVFDSYGGRETMLVAAECAAHEGLHISTENILVELLVTENGRQRAAVPGEIGEVAVTDLHNFGSPLIRYVNGDLAVRENPGMCGCGRYLERLRSVDGRKTDTFRDAMGERVHGMLFPALMLHYATALRHYQAIQHVDRSVTLKVVPTPDFAAARARLLETLEEVFRGLPITIEEVPEIPYSTTGKRRPVIVEVS
ncbi:MAG: hypothetical protein ABIP39_14805 [Polyangiaceae bacterium]